jgi:succinoglycan biosynthesis transport protein ExoP
MLQINKPRLVPEQGATQTEFVTPAELYALLVGFIQRQGMVIALAALVALVLAATYILTAPGMYTGHAVMVIDTHKTNTAVQQLPFGDGPMDAGMVDTQIEILNSENVALSVIKDLHLDKDPEFVSPRRSIFGTAAALAMNLLTFWIPENNAPEPTATTTTPQSSDSQTLGSASASVPKPQTRLMRGVLATFQGRLKLKRVGLTYAIEIDFQSTSPQRAAQIANALAEAYVVDALEAKYLATRRASAWLQGRLNELREQSATAGRAVIDFKARNNIVESGGRLMNEQQLAELNSSLIQAGAQSAEAQARLDRIQQILNENGSDIAGAATATVTDTLHNDVITKLRQKYLDYAQKEADFSKRYGAGHLAAVNLRNQMAEIRRSIGDELHRIAETYKSDLEIAKKREESVQKALAAIVTESQTTNEAQITLRDLDSKAQSYRALYDNFLQHYMESVQQQSVPVSEARVITEATRPFSKSSPKIPLILAAAVVGGIILGCGAGALREVADRSFRTSRQIEQHLHANCIGVVPLFAAAKRPAPNRPVKSCDTRTILRDRAPEWAAVDLPFSGFAEAIRSLKVAADMNRESKSQVIGITSSLPNEGKSTIATALAASLAHGGRHVLLVDCDLRNPSLSRRLAPGAETGIVQMVCGEAWLNEVAWSEPSTKLTFVPAVLPNRLPHSREFLASAATRRVFEALREGYEYIIVDLSPLAPVVDVRGMSHLVDSFIFVVEWGGTKMEVAEHALADARSVYDNLLGVVLNKVEMRTIGRYEGNRRPYYRNRHFARYGYTE